MIRLSLSSTALLCLLAVSASASNIVVLPQENSNSTVANIYTSFPFAAVGAITVDPLAFEAHWHPNGQKFYVISKGVQKSIGVYNGTAPFTEIASRSLPNISMARLTPDGRRLYALSLAVRVYETTNDQEVVGINVGSTPIDIDFALDNSRAYILGSNGTLTAVDIFSNRVVSTLNITGNPNSVMVGPTGLIYVTASNRILEIDGRDTLTQVGNDIPITGSNCLKTQFTPDGSRLVSACAVSGATNVFVVDVVSRTVTNTAIGGSVAERFKVISNSTALFYIGASNTVFRAGLVAPIANPTQFDVVGFGALNGGRYLITSDEVPTVRTFFPNSNNSISRISLDTNIQTATLVQSTVIGPMFFTGPASTGLPFSLITISPQQTVAAGQRGRPLVVRVLDSSSRPLSGVTVNFSTPSPTLQLSASAAVTNKDGFAMISYEAPATTGVINVTASTAGSQGQNFTINVTGGTTGGGGGTGGGGTGTTTPPIEIVKGNGQLLFAQFIAPEQLTVRVRDGAGKPQPNASVAWQVLSGEGNLTFATTTTDADGVTGNQFGSNLYYNDGFNGARATVIRASAANGTVDFTVTSYPSSGPPPLLLPASPPSITLLSPSEGSIIRVPAGSIAPGAVRATIVSGTLQGFGSPIANVGMSASTGGDPLTGPSANCTQSNLSNGQGEVSCDLQGGSRLGNSTLNVCVGNCQSPGRSFFFNLEVTSGPPAIFVKKQGDNQSGGPGTVAPLALRAAVTDAFGNLLSGQTVRVEIISGEATLESVFNTTNRDGEFSFLVRFGSTPGQVVIRTTAGAATATWTVTNNVSVGNFVRVSGDAQSAVVGRAFAQPLVVQLFDATARPISGAAVSFAVTNGAASLSATTATTNANGQAQVSVTAGSTAGPITVNVTSLNRSVSFSLSAVPPGPIITRVSNAASFVDGLVPCGLATIFGSNMAPTLNGSVSGNSFVGAYPTRLLNIQVDIAGRPAPIVSVSRINSEEQVTIQAPCELSAGPATLRMTIGEGSGTAAVRVLPVQPAIFETTDSANRKVAVIVKPDGTYMSLENPIVRGERVIGFFTGLGQTRVPAVTNNPGAFNNSSQVAAQIVVGVNNEGVDAPLAIMAPGLVGIYVIQFEVPEATTPGTYRPFGIGAVGPDSVYVPSNASAIHIR
jgi:uncharacterized protein (TIGR03437 family)